MRGIKGTWRFRIAKIIMFRCSRKSQITSAPECCLIKPKLGERHGGDMVIQNCSNRSVQMSKMAPRAAILKLFKQQQLPNYKFD